MNAKVVEFPRNQPVRVSLRWPDGLRVRNGAVRRYVLTDGRVMFLMASVAAMIDRLELRSGDSISICKTYQRGRVAWQVYRAVAIQMPAIVGAIDPTSFDHYLAQEGEGR